MRCCVPNLKSEWNNSQKKTEQVGQNLADLGSTFFSTGFQNPSIGIPDHVLIITLPISFVLPFIFGGKRVLSLDYKQLGVVSFISTDPGILW